MTATETLASILLMALAGGMCYIGGRLMGWPIIALLACIDKGYQGVKWIGKQLYRPVIKFKKWRKDIELKRLIEESMNADNRRALRRKAEDFLDYPRPRELPLLHITNPMVQ